jgi:hypothetical protein
VHNTNHTWDTRMSRICDELKSRGIRAFASRETHSCVVLPADDLGSHPEDSGWDHVFSAPEVFISEDELASDDYTEIVLRKVTSALGYMPRH